jgi:hypothetical protein
MTVAVALPAKSALRRAAARARMAPSDENSQPWAFRLGSDRFGLRMDILRRVPGPDPDGRQAILDCGRALLNARAALAAGETSCAVVRFPDGPSADLLARIVPVPPGDNPVPYEDLTGHRRLAGLESAITTNGFEDADLIDVELSRPLMVRLASAAASEGTALVCLLRTDHRNAVLTLNQRAGATGAQPPKQRTVAHKGPLPTLFVLSSPEEDPLGWLRAGEALHRVTLELAAHGLVCSPVTPILEVPATRAALRRGLGMTGHPQQVFRVGRVGRIRATARRPLREMLSEEFD